MFMFQSLLPKIIPYTRLSSFLKIIIKFLFLAENMQPAFDWFVKCVCQNLLIETEKNFPDCLQNKTEQEMWTKSGLIWIDVLYSSIFCHSKFKFTLRNRKKITATLLCFFSSLITFAITALSVHVSHVKRVRSFLKLLFSWPKKIKSRLAKGILSVVLLEGHKFILREQN